MSDDGVFQHAKTGMLGHFRSLRVRVHCPDSVKATHRAESRVVNTLRQATHLAYEKGYAEGHGAVERADYNFQKGYAKGYEAGNKAGYSDGVDLVQGMCDSCRRLHES